MYTTSDHILVYFQTFSGKENVANLDYVRVIAVNKSLHFFEELKTVYNITASNEDIHMFYNCGDLYERLVNDLQFKRFKNRVFKSVCSGLWLLGESSEDNIKWYNEVLIDWIKQRLSTYIDDMEEDSLSCSIKNELWKFKWDFITTDYLKLNLEEDKLDYYLLNYENTSDSNYVISTKHIMSLIALYANLNYGKVTSDYNIESGRIIKNNKTGEISLNVDNNNTNTTDNSSFVEEDNTNTNINDFIIKESDNNRCLILNKNVLSTFEVESILEYLNVDTDVLFKFAMSFEFSRLQKNILDAHSLYIPTESAVFGLNYAPLTGFEINRCIGDLDYFNTEPNLTSQCTKKIVDTSKNVSIYKNLLDDSVNIFNDDLTITTLTEFERISTYSYKSTITENIINTINKNTITKQLIEELFELIKILNTNDLEEEDPCKDEKNQEPKMDLQHIVTKTYVDQYKNDNVETVASTVIDNVYKYLKQSALHENYINKNKIGQDLVTLGVKKVRKSKGYFYGMEDSNEKESNLMDSVCKPVIDTQLQITRQNPELVIDYSKVDKTNYQLRPLPRTTNIDYSLFSTMKPGSFIKVEGKSS